MKKFLAALLALILACPILGAQPPRVPESVTFAGETIRFDRSDLYERMDRELLTFTYMHTTSILMLKRSDRIFNVIVPILRRYGIPEDLKYLCVIESNLDPQAVSPAGAAGLWQFMAGSGKEYGLEVNANVDERYNIEKATIAACRYLKRSYARFGDWLSVAACYNAGPAAIAARMESQQEKRAADLWLVNETSRYMFRMLAAKMMFEDPAAFGFDVPEGERYPVIQVKEIVEVNEAIPDLAVFAKDHGISFAQLKRANLWLRESKLNNASHRNYEIIIPKEPGRP
ncbi:MAG: lytic transglycosylase domain-containing protein [Bacteroidales bacterium]|nr:lytic transglycosylase domain-containing protein [Bacteroidales bacterium]